MAPKPAESPPSDEHDEETQQFIKELAAYHEKRGTTFDPNPKVGQRHINLLRLYNRVIEEGGYDKVSDTKNNKLAWRKLSTDFLPSNSNIVTLAFQLKTVFYKYLAAYEISTFHKKEPPPREILEDLTARGGDLLNRTLENYAIRANRETDNLGNLESNDDSDHTSTPRGDKMDLDDPANSSGRVTRGLRHAPPQRVLFGSQVESTSRSTRSAVHHANSPASGVGGSINGTYNLTGNAGIVANYEPRPQVPVTVKPVSTPSNNRAYFQELVRRQREKIARNQSLKQPPGMMLPGTGFPGPNIYVKCLRALESAIPAEIDYALYHLVKISHERGDKFQFNSFANLADNLMQVVCSASTIWFEHPGWDYSWEDTVSDNPTLLNQLNGTPNLLKKINSFAPRKMDSLESSDFRTKVTRVNQAALVLRNMVMLEDNARILGQMNLVRDMLTIVLRLPIRGETVELKYYALEIWEPLVKYWILGANDELYRAVIDTIEDNLGDRGLIVHGIRALSSISMSLEAINRLDKIPQSLLEHVYQWLLVEDEELQLACLDFLYQYTAITENVEFLTSSILSSNLVDLLMTTLTRGAVRVPVPSNYDQRTPRYTDSGPPDVIPKLSPSIIEKLCQITNPNEHSAAWLRTCFVANFEGQVTQLALWSAYNDAFKDSSSQNSLMQAKDFIQNVSIVFKNAQARVVPDGVERGRSKFIMQGILPRATPCDIRDRPYVRCMWQTPVTPSTEAPPTEPQPGFKECDIWFPSNNAEELWIHILNDHLEVPRHPDHPHKFKDVTTGRQFACLWSGCDKYPAPGIEDAHQIGMHVKSHLPDHGPGAAHRAKYARDPSLPASRPTLGWFEMHPPLDDKGYPTGLPIGALRVLRNMARHMVKIDAADGTDRYTLLERHFTFRSAKIYQVYTNTPSLRQDVLELLHFVGYIGRSKDGNRNDSEDVVMTSAS